MPFTITTVFDTLFPSKRNLPAIVETEIRKLGQDLETIGSNSLWSLLSNSEGAESVSCSQVRRDSGHFVKSYLDLATKIAELQFRNRDYVLLFRGQSEDYLNRQKNTTLKPTLFRNTSTNQSPTDSRLEARFTKLLRAERILISEYSKRSFLGTDRLRRHQILRWAILQHYEICRTPLLDVTQSLRIAASFASKEEGNEAYVFVVGVPNISGGITASDEAGLQIVRLSSACPPSAVRPHVQEGYLLGEYPGMVGIDQKENYRPYEMDFGRRLVAKFRFNPRRFWRKNDAFPLITKNALYPDDEDPLSDLGETVKQRLILRKPVVST